MDISISSDLLLRRRRAVHIDITRQRSAQIQSRPAQQRFDALGGQPHDFGDFRIIHILKLVKHHRHALPFVETRQRFLNESGQFLALDLLHRPAAIVFDLLAVRPQRPRLAGDERRHRLALARAQAVPRQVVGDGEQPGGEFAARLVLLRAR